MDFSHSPKVLALQDRVMTFVREQVLPAESQFKAEMDAFRASGNPWQNTPTLERLKASAKAAGLWNMFLPESKAGAGLSNLEYAPLCEIMGRYPPTAEAMNCSAPDTGNMEILERFGTPEQKQRWLVPLLAGEIRSGFAMTEPAVASSDATQIECRIERQGDQYVINGRKWWTSGAPDPRCQILILMGKTDPAAATYRQQSMVLVPKDTPGVKVERALSVFGYDHAPHGHAEMSFSIVRVPKIFATLLFLISIGNASPQEPDNSSTSTSIGFFQVYSRGPTRFAPPMMGRNSVIFSPASSMMSSCFFSDRIEYK